MNEHGLRYSGADWQIFTVCPTSQPYYCLMWLGDTLGHTVHIITTQIFYSALLLMWQTGAAADRCNENIRVLAQSMNFISLQVLYIDLDELSQYPILLYLEFTVHVYLHQFQKWETQGWYRDMWCACSVHLCPGTVCSPSRLLFQLSPLQSVNRIRIEGILILII